MDLNWERIAEITLAILAAEAILCITRWLWERRQPA